MMPIKPRPIMISQHPALSPENMRDAQTQLKHRLYLSKKATPAEYIKLLSGAYGHDRGDISYLDDILRASKFNTIRNNSAVVKRLLENIKSENVAGAVKQYDSERLIHHILENHSISPGALSAILSPDSNVDMPSYSNFAHKQPHINTQHLKQLIDRDVNVFTPENIKILNKDVVDYYLSNPKRKFYFLQLGTLIDSMKNEDSSKRLIDQNGLIDLLEKKKIDGSGWGNIDKALNVLEPEQRKQILDKWLGIHGGSFTNDPNEDTEDYNRRPDFYDYNNWDVGSGYSSKLAAQALQYSKHLTDEQIQHIKRHGNMDEKWALFHNVQIDPSHQIEMYNNWIHDNSDRGYSLDDFTQHIKDNNEFSDNSDDYYDQAREEIEADNPISDYISENYSDEDLLSAAGDHADRDEWIKNHLENNYKWTVDGDKQLTLDGQEEDASDYSDDMESHPEYYTRYNEAADAYDARVQYIKDHYYDELSNRESERIEDGYRDYLDHDIYERARTLYDDDMENAHENYDFLPQHLRDKIPHVNEQMQLARLSASEAAAREAQIKEAANKEYLDKYIPNRQNQHLYAEGQHHLEMAKEYSDAKGGSIDIGTLNKLHPNLKDKWKSTFGNKGKLTSEEIQSKIDGMPKTTYNVSYAPWTSSQMQNLNKQDEVVVRLDHSDDSVKALTEDSDVHELFRKIQDVSQRSGHPTNINTVGWARVDTNDPKHWIVDELQSDFSSSARKYLEQHGKDKEAALMQKIIDYHKGWRERLLNHVIKTAKLNGVEKISTHSPESKAAHTGSDTVHTVYNDSYSKVPKQLGFRASNYKELPLTASGKSVFLKNISGNNEDRLGMHRKACEYHAQLARAHTFFASAQTPTDIVGDISYPIPNEEQKAIHIEYNQQHLDKFRKHLAVIKNMDPTSPEANVRTVTDWYNKQGPLSDSNQLKHINSGLRMAYDDIRYRSHGATDASSHPADQLLEETQGAEPLPAHTLDLTLKTMKSELHMADFLMKAEIDSGSKTKIAQALSVIKDNDGILKQIQQNNPQAYNGIHALVSVLIDLIKQTGEKPEEWDNGPERKKDAGPQQDQQQGQPAGNESAAPHHINKNPEYHRRQMSYAPGSIRDYAPGDERTKTADGDWKSTASGLRTLEEQS